MTRSVVLESGDYIETAVSVRAALEYQDRIDMLTVIYIRIMRVLRLLRRLFNHDQYVKVRPEWRE